MTTVDLVDRLAALPSLAEIPREELEWLVAHGAHERSPAGQIMAPMGQRIEHLWIIFSGHISAHVDRGVGPRRVIGWRDGDVTGMLPFSRMKGPPGDLYFEEETELLSVHEKHFPELIRECPRLTAYSVHLMLDRARRFHESDFEDEKMIALGKIAAGLAHELNNPASATVRGAKLLTGLLDEVDSAAQALGAAALSDEQRNEVRRFRANCLAERLGHVLTPIERADREDEIAGWLMRQGCHPEYAERLAETDVRIEALEALSEVVTGETLEHVLRWIATGCETHSLALDIEQAARRIRELVDTVKRFTQMDGLAAPEAVDVEDGLRDTIRILAAKAKAKGIGITLEAEGGLPRVQGVAGELNQVWLNLIDNALDAVADSGRIAISARRELDRVVVRVVDDGPGIPPTVQPRIFDAFFTTKPPGQGMGLGLDITRRLVRRYQGEISVESWPGHTEFRVSLVPEVPLASMPPAEPQ
jgi:signal transduction histidine kinase